MSYGTNAGIGFGATTAVTLFLFGFVALGMWGCPQYNVWQQGLVGEAELRRAQQNRQIRIEEAQAKLASAELEAKAETIRADGVAQANQIIGEGLGGPEAYLRYRYILMLEETGGQGRETIYIPTEAGLPILEATRRQQ